MVISIRLSRLSFLIDVMPTLLHKNCHWKSIDARTWTRLSDQLLFPPLFLLFVLMFPCIALNSIWLIHLHRVNVSITCYFFTAPEKLLRYPIKSRQQACLPVSALMGCRLNPEWLLSEPCSNGAAEN